MDDLFRVRTSETDPLMIDEIQLPDHLEGCALGITFCPGKTETTPTGNWARDLQADLAVIRDWAPDFIILALAPAEAEALRVKGLERAIEKATRYKPTYQDAWCDWPAPRTADRRFIDILPRMFRGYRRVLIIGRNGGARSGNIATELLMRDAGMRQLDRAIAAVNAARPHAVDTVAQRDYLSHHWHRRRLPGPTPDLTAPAVTAAKTRAARLRRMMAEDGQDISLSASLERVARLEGYRDWNGYRASLVRQDLHHSEDMLSPSGASSALDLQRYIRHAYRHFGMSVADDNVIRECREAENLAGPEVGFSHTRHRTVAKCVHEGVRSFFGPNAPDYLRRLLRAHDLPERLDPRYLRPEGYRDVADIPQATLEDMADDPNFLELLILHEAGYGTTRGLEEMRSSSVTLFDFNLKAAINGEKYCKDAGREQFGFGAMMARQALRHALS